MMNHDPVRPGPSPEPLISPEGWQESQAIQDPAEAGKPFEPAYPP